MPRDANSTLLPGHVVAAHEQTLQGRIFAYCLYGISQTKPLSCITERERDVKRMEGNVLFNDALNTFYIRLYGVRHMVKDHSDSEKGNPLPPQRLLFPISSKGSFICTIKY